MRFSSPAKKRFGRSARPVTSLVLIACMFGIAADPLSAQDKVNFEDHIKPIFRAKCLSCHNTNKKTADLDLSNYTAMMQGGGSGASIEIGDPDSSYLFMLINHDSEPYMPPNSDRIPDGMIATVRKWIEQGAPETASSKVMLPKKQNVSLNVDVSAGARPEGPPPMPDVLGLEPVVHTSATTAVSAIATSPWAKLVAVAGQKQVVLYHSETLQPLGVLPFPEGQARVLKFSRTGGLLLAGGGHGASKGLAVVWNVKTGERVIEAGDELDEVLAADISADQSLVAVGGPGKIVRVYSTATGELAYEITKHTDWIYSLEFSPDSILLATSDRSGGLHVWESYTGRNYLTLNGHKGAVNVVSWRIDSNVLASASADASVKLWELENGKNIKSWNAHGGGTLSMEFCRDGRLVTSGRDKVAKIWDQNGKQLRAFEAFSDLAVQVSHCDETDRVIAGDWTGEVRVWNAADGKRIGNLTTNPPQLQVRLDQAKAQQTAVAQKLAAAQKKLAEVTAQKTAHQQKIDAAAKTVEGAKKVHADRVSAQKQQEAALVALNKKKDGLQQRLTVLQQAVPELEAAAKQATEAAGLMSQDPELKKVSDELTAKVNERKAEQSTTAENLKTATTEITAATTQLAATKKQVAQDLKAIEAQQKNLVALTQAMKPIDEQLAAAQGALQGVTNEANAANSLVARWTEYIHLQNELSAMAAKREQKNQVQLASLEAKALVDEKQAEINAAQQKMTATNNQLAAVKKQIGELEAALAAAQQKMTTSQQTLAQLQKVIPLLQGAAQQSKAALGMLPEDADIKSSVTAVETTLAARQKRLAELTTQVDVLQKEMATTKQTMETSKATMVVAEKELATVRTAVEGLSKEIAPLKSAAEAANAKLTAAEAELKQAADVVEARREKLRPQVSLTQAAL